MSYKTGYNTSESPLVDSEGGVLGGREWWTIDTTDPVTKDNIETGVIVVVDRPKSGSRIHPDAKAAFDNTDIIIERSQKAMALDKNSLQDLAEDAGLIEEGEKVGVADLREAVAEDASVKLPSKNPKKREA